MTSLAVESYEREEFLLFSAVDDAGLPLEQETCEKLFNCMAESAGLVSLPEATAERLNAEAERHIKGTISQSLESNNLHFNEAREKLEKWADDLVLAAEKALAREAPALEPVPAPALSDRYIRAFRYTD